jgi:DNA-binding IclR family transcriptional regulator
MSIKSTSRTPQILEAFAQARRLLMLGELVRAIDAPRSSCLALLGTVGEKRSLWGQTQ